MARLFVDISPLRDSRDFRLLFGGQLASMFGNQVTLVAIPYQVYLQTHQSLWVGLTALIQLPFLVIGSLWGGAVGDRIDRRRVLMFGSAVLMCVSIGLALNAQFHDHDLVLLLALAALSSGFGGFSSPARSAAIPQLVRQDQLVAAYSINQIVIQLSSIVGPTLAGPLLAVNVAFCYWFDAATFVVLLLATSALRPLQPLGNAAAVSIWKSVKQGATYVRGHVMAQCVYLVDLNAMIFGMPTALFPALALVSFHGGTITLGFLYAAPGVGAFIGASTTGWVERIKKRGRAVVLAVVIWGISIAIFGFSHYLWLALIFLGIAGWADVISAVLRNTILQTSITDEFRSRLSSIQMAVVAGGPRLGAFESGVVASFSSTEISIVSGGIACVVGAFALAKWRPSFWTTSTAD